MMSSDCQFKAVVGEGYADGEASDDFVVKAYVVIHVSEVGLSRLYSVDDVECFIDGEVCEVVFVA